MLSLAQVKGSAAIYTRPTMATSRPPAVVDGMSNKELVSIVLGVIASAIGVLVRCGSTARKEVMLDICCRSVVKISADFALCGCRPFSPEMVHLDLNIRDHFVSRTAESPGFRVVGSSLNMMEYKFLIRRDHINDHCLKQGGYGSTLLPKVLCIRGYFVSRVP